MLIVLNTFVRDEGWAAFAGAADAVGFTGTEGAEGAGAEAEGAGAVTAFIAILARDAVTGEATEADTGSFSMTEAHICPIMA